MTKNDFLFRWLKKIDINDCEKLSFETNKNYWPFCQFGKSFFFDSDKKITEKKTNKGYFPPLFKVTHKRKISNTCDGEKLCCKMEESLCSEIKEMIYKLKQKRAGWTCVIACTSCSFQSCDKIDEVELIVKAALFLKDN